MKNLLLILSYVAVQNLSAAPLSDSSGFYFSKGITEKNEKRFLTASANFEKAISFNKSYAEAYIENAYANKEMRKTDQAKANFLFA